MMKVLLIDDTLDAPVEGHPRCDIDLVPSYAEACEKLKGNEDPYQVIVCNVPSTRQLIDFLHEQAKGAPFILARGVSDDEQEDDASLELLPLLEEIYQAITRERRRLDS
jgi:hypothetical protein